MPQSKPTTRPEIKLIAGLGNPGDIYKNTYHNIGLMAVDWLKDKSENAGPWGKAGNSFEYAKSKGMIWVKPLVFMNESGVALAKAKKYFKIPAENILVIHDESDLQAGNFKMQFDKNSAGHKGVESIINSLGTQKFWRVRIGVRGQKNKKRALDFVLKKIVPAHKGKMEDVFKKISELLK